MNTRSLVMAPFPYFGGKRKIAPVVWSLLGDPENYVEPFFGSGAVLLSRHGGSRPGKVETVNDANRFVSNFWRASIASPEAVAAAADWPVNETDLEARHYWLVTDGAARLGEIMCDPDAYDARIAGVWLWGACAWIGGGWCSGSGPWVVEGGQWRKAGGRGINRKLPHLGNAGMGINRKLPHLGDAGRGINRKLPHLGDAGRGEYIRGLITDIQARMRDVRVACGDWTRVTGPSVTRTHGITGIYLDPPYEGVSEDKYTEDARWADIVAWCESVGDSDDMRIVLSGYEGSAYPHGWAEIAWQTRGGYGSRSDGRGRANKHRERLWHNHACIIAQEGLL